MGIDKKGIYFSIDALIALIIIFFGVLIVVPLVYENEPDSYLKSDLIMVFSTLEIGEINNSLIQGLISSGYITNLNNSVLETVGQIYVRDEGLSKQVMQSILDDLYLEENIGIWYNDDLLASVNKTSYESAKEVSVDRQIISGIGKGQDIEGFVAKAWLKKIDEKKNSRLIRGDFVCGGWKTYSWGDYCSSVYNKIIYNLDIPLNSTIENATWLLEGSWINQYVQAYVNGNKVYQGQINYYELINITSWVNEGNNVLYFNSTQGGDDGASFILADYATSQMQTYKYETIIPFNMVETKAVLHYEKPIFIPNEILEMNISINTSSDTTLSLRKGADNIIIAKKSPSANRVNFSSSEILSKLTENGLSYSDLSDEYFYFILDIGKDTPGANVYVRNNSFVEIASAEITMPYGTIDISQSIPLVSYTNRLQDTFYRNLVWEFFIPLNSIPIYADWQFGWLSTSNSETNQNAHANSILLFSSPPEEFRMSFNRFGYTPEKEEGIIVEGKNNFTLDFGNDYGVSSEASNGFLTYFIKSYVNYGDAKSKAEGGETSLEFEDGSSKVLMIGNQSDPWDPEVDALDDAVERLVQQLDSDNNSKVDLLISEDEIDIDAIDISGVPYIWQTEVQVRSWR